MIYHKKVACMRPDQLGVILYALFQEKLIGKNDPEELMRKVLRFISSDSPNNLMNSKFHQLNQNFVREKSTELNKITTSGKKSLKDISANLIFTSHVEKISGEYTEELFTFLTKFSEY